MRYCADIEHRMHARTVIEHRMHAQLSNTKCTHIYRTPNAPTVIEHQMHAQLSNTKCTHSKCTPSYRTPNACTAIKHQSKREMPCHLLMFDKMFVHAALLRLRIRKRVMCHVPLLSAVQTAGGNGGLLAGGERCG